MCRHTVDRSSSIPVCILGFAGIGQAVPGIDLNQRVIVSRDLTARRCGQVKVLFDSVLALQPRVSTGCQIALFQKAIKSPFFIALMCTASRRIPASASPNHKSEKGDLVTGEGAVRLGAGAAAARVYRWRRVARGPTPPAPCTLHPAPCTLHPAPCTLHPAPCTLHPAPCTLHPAS